MNTLPSPIRPLCIALLITTCLPVTQAQDYVDIVKVEHTRGVGQSFHQGGGHAPFSETAIDLTLPIVLHKKTALITGALLEQTHLATHPESSAFEVYGAMAKLGINRKHTSRWSGTYLLLPKLSSNLEGLNGNDVQMGALVLLKYQPKAHLNYRVGCYANTDRFGPMVVPIAGIYWLRGRTEVSAALPITADINYRLLPHLRLGTRFAGINKTYHLHHEPGKYLEKVNNEWSVYAHMDWGRMNMQLFAGHSIARSFKSYDSDDRIDLSLSALKFGNDRMPVHTGFGDGFIFKAALFYRIPTA